MFCLPKFASTVLVVSAKVEVILLGEISVGKSVCKNVSCWSIFRMLLKSYWRTRKFSGTTYKSTWFPDLLGIGSELYGYLKNDAQLINAQQKYLYWSSFQFPYISDNKRKSLHNNKKFFLMFIYIEISWNHMHLWNID